MPFKPRHTVPNTRPSWAPATTAKVALGTAFGAALLLVSYTLAFSPHWSPREMKKAFRDARRYVAIAGEEGEIPAGAVAEITLAPNSYPERPSGSFKLVDQTGRLFGSDDLKGKWWVGAFIFTGCGSTCPRMAGALQHVQASLGDNADDIRLVCFSVDSDNDTPERLAQFGERFGANPERWKFLTGVGKREEIWMMAKKNFFAGVLEADENAEEPIMHSRQLFLVNPEGRIVHHCDGLAAEEVECLIKRLSNL